MKMPLLLVNGWALGFLLPKIFEEGPWWVIPVCMGLVASLLIAILWEPKP